MGYRQQAGWAREVDTGWRWSWTREGEAWRRQREGVHGGPRGGGDNARIASMAEEDERIKVGDIDPPKEDRISGSRSWDGGVRERRQKRA